MDKTPEPPSWLQPAGQKAFRRLRHLVADERDLPAFEILSAALGEYHDAVEELQAQGRTCEGERGGVKAHPLLSYAKSQYDAAMKGLAEFGLTPKARAAMVREAAEEATEEESPADQLARVLSGGDP